MLQHLLTFKFGLLPKLYCKKAYLIIAVRHLACCAEIMLCAFVFVQGKHNKSQARCRKHDGTCMVLKYSSIS